MSYVIASSKLWIPDMHLQLEREIGEPFHLIQRKADLTLESLRQIKPKALFFPHWSFLVPPEIHQNFKCIMFHMTDLPYGRGGSPLQNLIVRGHRETKISAFLCDGGLDTGPIYLKEPLSLDGKAQDIFLRGQKLIYSMILQIIRENPLPVPQTGPVVEFKRRKPEDGNLLSAQNLNEIHNFIRMLDADGYPPAFLDIGPYRIEFTQSTYEGQQIMAQARITRNEK